MVVIKILQDKNDNASNLLVLYPKTLYLHEFTDTYCSFQLGVRQIPDSIISGFVICRATLTSGRTETLYTDVTGMTVTASGSNCVNPLYVETSSPEALLVSQVWNLVHSSQFIQHV